MRSLPLRLASRHPSRKGIRRAPGRLVERFLSARVRTLTRPRQADEAQALRRAATAAALRPARRSCDAADRVGVRPARRRQDDAGRELSRSTRPASPLVSGRHRRQRPRDVRALHADGRAAARGEEGGRAAALQPGAPAGHRALRANLFPRVLFRIAAAYGHRARQLPGSPHRQRAARPHSRMRSRRFPTASRSSRSPAATHRRSSPGSSRVAASRGSSLRRLPARPTKRKRSWAAVRWTRRRCSAHHAPKRRLGGGARAAARALEPRRRDARRFDRRRQGRDLPVLRRRDLQSRAAREPAHADADRDSAIVHASGGGGAGRRRADAAIARLPLSAAPLHRPPARHADDLPLPRAVSRIPARGSEAAALEPTSGASRARAPPCS